MTIPNFRGTSNNWGVTPMSPTSVQGVYKITQSFNDQPYPGFKIDFSKDWSQAWGRDDYHQNKLNKAGYNVEVKNNKTYTIFVNEEAKEYLIFEVNISLNKDNNVYVNLTENLCLTGLEESLLSRWYIKNEHSHHHDEHSHHHDEQESCDSTQCPVIDMLRGVDNNIKESCNLFLQTYRNDILNVIANMIKMLQS